MLSELRQRTEVAMKAKGSSTCRVCLMKTICELSVIPNKERLTVKVIHKFVSKITE